MNWKKNFLGEARKELYLPFIFDIEVAVHKGKGMSFISGLIYS